MESEVPSSFNSGRFHVSPVCLGHGIGKDSSASVFLGTDRQDPDCPVAVKRWIKTPTTERLFQRDITAYGALGDAPGIPKIIWHGLESGCCLVVMELLLPDLETVFKNLVWQKAGTFDMENFVAMLAIQMLDVLEHVHSKGLLHCDISPYSFCLGPFAPTDARIYLIDFSHAEMYCRRADGQHVPQREETRGFSGHAKFASTNALRGHAVSRRDDLISFAYTIIYLVQGNLHLPLVDDTPPNSVLCATLADVRQQQAMADHCARLPRPFERVLSYVVALGFEDVPDYEGLRGLFRSLLADRGVGMGGDYGISVETLFGGQVDLRFLSRAFPSPSAIAFDWTGGGKPDDGNAVGIETFLPGPVSGKSLLPSASPSAGPITPSLPSTPMGLTPFCETRRSEKAGALLDV